MAGDKKIAQSEPVAAGLKSNSCTKLAEQNMASRKDGIRSDSILTYSGGDAIPTVKGETDQKSVAGQGVFYPPTSCYDYHYPGYCGTFSQLDDHGYVNASGGSYAGIQSDNGSLLYYLPGYDPYATGTFLGVDGQQPYFSSSGYSQHSASYGSEAMPYYSWDSMYGGDITHGTTAPWNTNSALSSNGSVKSNVFNSKKTMNTINGKASNLPLDMRPQQSTATSNISKSPLQTQRLKPLNNKLGSGFQSGGLGKGYQPVGNFSPFINQNQGLFARSYPLSYSPNVRAWDNNDRFKLREKSYRNGESESSGELTRGPRANNNIKPINLSIEEKPALSFRMDQYNLEDFQIAYDNAKFYVIKSYSEDDVHKCVKYDVWSSTPNGNKKLDAAFIDAEGKTSETGMKCPVFLFFSVNASGQFVGVAEMVGRVDFDKNMDFWQLDKWNGFFPVKWHIIKDIPNTQLRHIILENNDNRPVTYTRDTQEIGLMQGLEMLNIFKSYSAKTNLLDDFNFYENREKLLRAKRSSMPAFQPEMYRKDDFPKNLKAGEKMIEEGSVATNSSSDPTSSLINLARNLSLNSKTLKTPTVVGSGDKSVPLMSSSKAF